MADNVIIGIAEAAPLKEDPGDYWGLAARAAVAALQDAGLNLSDVDGIVFSSVIQAPFITSAAQFGEYMGIKPAWYSNVPFGGTPTSEHFLKAQQAIASGLAKTVLIVSADNQVARFGRRNVVEAMASLANDPEWEWPYGLIIPSNFAMIAKRHMWKYGTTSDQLARVAVAERQWAQMHPTAEQRDPLTVEDVLNSPMISSPLHMLDMSLISDRAAAVVMVDSDRSRASANVPIRLTGFGECADSQHFSQMSDPTDIVSLRVATNQALDMAGRVRGDMNIVYPYDASTISVIVELEAMGFCDQGRGGAFVSDGRIAPGGDFPINTHGGLLSNSHPGPPGSLLQSIEAIRQLRGEAGERQVAGAEMALCHGEGGFYSNQVNIFERCDV